MSEALIRTEKIFGPEAMARLSRCRVALFGLGGVGGHAAEALARSGIGALDLIDADRFAESNLNRQLLAADDTIGQFKTDAAAERIRHIAPDCQVTKHTLFFSAETAGGFDFAAYDYVLDAIDSVASKLLLIRLAKAAGTPVISSMGTGGKADPTKLTVSDIYETSVCPLAKVMRHECRKAGITELKVVWSREEPLAPMPASTAFVPSAAGIIMASCAVRELAAMTGPTRADLKNIE